jgi:hypothetical protein
MRLTEFGKAIGKGQGQEAGPTLHRQDTPRGGGGNLKRQHSQANQKYYE